MDVPFSHPTEIYPQKDGRKVRSRWEGTFTFAGAPRAGARTTGPAPLCAASRRLRRPLRPADLRVEISQVPREVVPSPTGSHPRGRGRAFNVRPHPLRHDREECDRTIHPSGINHLSPAAKVRRWAGRAGEPLALERAVAHVEADPAGAVAASPHEVAANQASASRGVTRADQLTSSLSTIAITQAPVALST